ncbi:MAG: mechanosensitive ion channel protein MscS [Lysobacterales bacterium CG17_big_fil_post_rev_8_21_14_2_50_64_11]|nr:MAG: mechanosensitive ion channel protein MscS [Xanthomonadales bacterium CG17_big_fil_post_rev_8_21_14_2_50_64_11]
MDRINQMLEYALHIGSFHISVGALLGFMGTLLLVWLAGHYLRRAFDRYAATRESNLRPAIYTVSRITYYLLVLAGLMVALSLLGIPVSRFAVFAGAIGVGLGFGLQAIFSNFISGLILLFDGSLKVGDFVELESGVTGEVSDINIRATRITTNDNIEILVPNAEFVTGRVVNWTHHEASRRLRISFGVAYGCDKERVKQAALEAAAEVPATLTTDGPRAPDVWLVEFGDSALIFELVVWLTADATKRPGSVKAAYNWALESALARYQLEIPFPQRDLHLRSVLGNTTLESLALSHKAGSGQRQAATASDAPAHEQPARNETADELAAHAANTRPASAHDA